MNLPNRLTVLRVVLALVFIFILPIQGLVAKSIALFIFATASFTDYLDGAIARKYGLITPFGGFLDPIADKALTFSAFCGFIQLGLIPAWMVVLIMVRELSVTGVRLLMRHDPKKASAASIGKHKTVIQFTAILSILIYLILRETAFWSLRWNGLAQQTIDWFMMFVVAFTVYSGYVYVWMNRQYLVEQAPQGSVKQ